MQGLNELKGFLFEGETQSPSIIIYSPHISPRLRYVSKFIFNQGLLCNFILTDNENEFIQSKLAKINYSIKTFESALNINPSGLLNQNKVQGIPSDYPEDIFSAVFYHISRYEEWISEKRDQHNRFVPETIFKTPVVDIRINEFK